VIVLDASVVAELVLRTPIGARAATRLARRRDSFHAPHLLDLEVASVLRRLAAGGAITPADARTALADLAALDLVRHPHDIFLPRIWQLRANLTSYDACYVALAETLRAPLCTCDTRLAAAPGHRATIELLAP
jgi:predicted nucleic acid-binding protein